MASTLVVEDGSIVAGADSYVAAADADAYFTKHGSPSAWTGATEAAKDDALRRATRYADAHYEWVSEIVSADQVLDWPRAGFYDREGRTIDADEIPQRLKDAVCELALAHISDGALDRTDVQAGATVKREKLDVLETEYFSGKRQGEIYPGVDALLRDLTQSSYRLEKAG